MDSINFEFGTSVCGTLTRLHYTRLHGPLLDADVSVGVVLLFRTVSLSSKSAIVGLLRPWFTAEMCTLHGSVFCGPTRLDLDNLIMTPEVEVLKLTLQATIARSISADKK